MLEELKKQVCEANLELVRHDVVVVVDLETGDTGEGCSSFSLSCRGDGCCCRDGFVDIAVNPQASMAQYMLESTICGNME
jgi:hypothetical protein